MPCSVRETDSPLRAEREIGERTRRPSLLPDAFHRDTGREGGDDRQFIHPPVRCYIETKLARSLDFFLSAREKFLGSFFRANSSLARDIRPTVTSTFSRRGEQFVNDL